MTSHLLLTTAGLAAVAVLATPSARAFSAVSTLTEVYGPFTPGTLIPDDQAVATSFLASINASAITSLTDVSIAFQLRGSPSDNGFANDMFASLLRSDLGGSVLPTDPAAMLLNRVDGSYDGWDVVLAGGGSGSVHDAVPSGSVLNGTFLPDDSFGAAAFDVFHGMSGNGDWRFNVADLAQFGTMELVSWSLTLTGERTTVGEVPEASTWAGGLGLVALVGGGWWRSRRRN